MGRFIASWRHAIPPLATVVAWNVTVSTWKHVRGLPCPAHTTFPLAQPEGDQMEGIRRLKGVEAPMHIKGPRMARGFYAPSVARHKLVVSVPNTGDTSVSSLRIPWQKPCSATAKQSCPHHQPQRHGDSEDEQEASPGLCDVREAETEMQDCAYCGLG